jgi:uncharacterized protein
MDLIPIFLTGLFTGALTCLAVQGGLLATTIAQRHEQELKAKSNQTGNALPILSFLAAKLVAYTILGLLLGWFGSLFQLSLTANIVLQFAVGIFMLGTAFNLLNVHPIFRYFIIQPPHFLTRLVRKESKSKNILAPAILGAFTVFIPCGATQAMMALAIASGNPLSGAAILFAFVLGTSPLFFLFGYLATRLGESMQQRFTKVAAYSLVLLAVFNLNNVLALTGSKVTLESFGKGLYCTVSYCEGSSAYASGAVPNDVRVRAVTEATIEFTETAYTPEVINVKAGENITLNLENKAGTGCVQAFTIPELNVQKIVQIGSTDTINFKAPSEPTQISFMCSMGMYRGTINVI